MSFRSHSVGPILSGSGDVMAERLACSVALMQWPGCRVSGRNRWRLSMTSPGQAYLH